MKDGHPSLSGVDSKGWVGALILVGLVALSFAGCSRWNVRPEERPHADRHRSGMRVPWPDSPRPCSRCHTLRREPTTTSEQEQRPKPSACEPYLLVGSAGGGSGLDLELIHLPVAGTEATDCSLLVAPVEGEDRAPEAEEEPMTQGLYRLVWRESNGSKVLRPVPVWKAPAGTDVGPAEPSPIIVWAGPGEPPAVNLAVVPTPSKPVPEEKPVRVVEVDLAPNQSGQIEFELLIDGGDRQISLTGTEGGNPSFDRVDCRPEPPGRVRCEGEYRELESVGGRRRAQKLEVLCDPAPGSLCLTVVFSPISK